MAAQATFCHKHGLKLPESAGERIFFKFWWKLNKNDLFTFLFSVSAAPKELMSSLEAKKRRARKRSKRLSYGKEIVVKEESNTEDPILDEIDANIPGIM